MILSSLGSVLRRGFKQLGSRIPTQILAALSMSVALTLAGSAYAIHLQLERLAVRLNQELRVVVFLKPGSADNYNKLAGEISTMEGVQGVVLLSSQETRERLGEMLGPQAGLLEGLAPEVVPPILEVELTPRGLARGKPSELMVRISKYREVDEAVYAGQVADRLESILERFTNLGRTVSAVLVLSGMFIIYATIRLTFMGRQEEREILRLIGARGWFIRGPFLVQGTVLGLVAGGISLALLQGLQVWLMSLPRGRSGAGPLWFLGEMRVVDPPLILVLLTAGALAGLVGSWLALGRVMGGDR